MRSEEVGDAVGEAVQTKTQLLAEKQAALVEAKANYNIAREMRDEEGMGIAAGKVDALRVLIAEIEAELIGQHEVEGVRRAKDRIVAIKRAYGSVQSSMADDEARVHAAVAGVADAITTLNNRYLQAMSMRAEAAALSDRFKLPKVALPDVEAPARGNVANALVLLPRTLHDAAWTNQGTEQCEFEMRTRRTYSECAGSVGAEIIATAGLKPFPGLTQHQQDIIASRAREKESMRRSLSGLPQIPARGNVPLGSL